MEKRKKTILIIDNASAFTGAFKSIFTVSRHLASQFNFIFCIPSGSTSEKYLSEKGVDYFKLPFLEISKRISALLLYFPVLLYNALRLLSVVSARNVDVIHVNDLYNMTGIVVKILRPRIKLVYHVRLMHDSYVKSLYYVWVKLILRFADHVVCNSYAVRKGLNTDSQKVQVIYNLPPAESRQAMSVVQDEAIIRLLYLANFTPGKGHDLAVEAFAAAVGSMPGNVKMIMSGGDLGKKNNVIYKQSLIEKARHLKVDSRISFTDFEPDIEKAMRNATIFLNFSESESFSMTCLEALTFGVPLIATDCGGPAELFENGRSGILVRNKDVEDMKQAIVRLCQDRTLREAFAKNGQEFVKSKFVLPEIIGKYITLYES